jgi:hypothetical protein
LTTAFFAVVFFVHITFLFVMPARAVPSGDFTGFIVLFSTMLNSLPRAMRGDVE